jgi:hypothetical protein
MHGVNEDAEHVFRPSKVTFGARVCCVPLHRTNRSRRSFSTESKSSAGHDWFLTYENDFRAWADVRIAFVDDIDGRWHRAQLYRSTPLRL